MIHGHNDKPASVLALNSADFLIAALATLFIITLGRKLVLLACGYPRTSLITLSSTPRTDVASSNSTEVASQLSSNMLNGRPLPAFLNGVANVEEFLASCPFMAALQANENDPVDNDGNCEEVRSAPDKPLSTSEIGYAEPDSSVLQLPVEDGSTELSCEEHSEPPRLTITLSSDEEAQERQACLAQLDRIHELMKSQPDRFGSVSVADMHQQLSHYYCSAEDSIIQTAISSSQ